MIHYEDKVRLRACGLLVENDKLLLVELFSPITKSLIWMPPGGGIKFREELKGTVKREFREETGLEVKVDNLLHVCELIEDRYHVIEFYYLVEKVSGELQLGTDPEYDNDQQILKQLAFKTREELKELNLSPNYLRDQLWRDIA